MQYYVTSDIASWIKENDIDLLKLLCENDWLHRPELVHEGRYLWTFDDYLILKEQLLRLEDPLNSWEDIWGRPTPSWVMENPRKKKLEDEDIIKSRVTGRPLKITKKTTGNAYVFWEGPSEYNGEKIALIITNLVTESKNYKTGPMSQAFIIVADQHPMEALASGADAAICGLCSHRGKVVEDIQRKKMGLTPREESKSKARSPERSCYVDMRSVISVWNYYKKGGYEEAGEKDWRKILSRSPYPLRFGAYGDPAMLPLSVIERLAAIKPEYTGYTALWELKWVQPYKRFLQASVPNIQKLYKAQEMGWSTYRAALSNEPPLDSETICPYEPEHWEKKGLTEIDESLLWQCSHCLICGGTEGVRQRGRIGRGGRPVSIVDPLHGPRGFHQEDRLGEEGRALWLPDPYAQEEMEDWEGMDV